MDIRFNIPELRLALRAMERRRKLGQPAYGCAGLNPQEDPTGKPVGSTLRGMRLLVYGQGGLIDTTLPRKSSSKRIRIRTKTDTGGMVEYTKARERNLVKELGSIAP